MHQLSDPALEAITKEWDSKQYDPPNTDIREWTLAIESLCDTYGIPDTQRAQCAAKSIKGDLRTELEKVLKDARARFGPIHWAQFRNFMIAFDQRFQETWEELPFYKKHSKLTGTALKVTGGVLLAPIAIVGTLGIVGFGPAGVVAGSLAAAIQSMVYGGATGGLFALLQSAGATMVLPSVGTVFAGAAAAGAGIKVTKDGSVATGELLSNSIIHGHPPRNDDDDDDSPPPYHQTIPREHLLTPQAILAILKSWDTTPYNPPGMDVAGWLGKIHKLCETYEVPLTQRALCAMHHMRADCRRAAHTAECYEMTWDQFATWLIRYDDAYRNSANRRIAELFAKKPNV